MSIWKVKPYKFNIEGNDTLLEAWREIRGLGERINNHWTIATLPIYEVQQVGFVDMGLHVNQTNAIDEDRLTFAENGRFVVNLRGIEYVDAVFDKSVNLEVSTKVGFTTDGSFNSIRTDVGNHDIKYTGTTKDSTLFTGVGWDRVYLIDPQLQPGGVDYYWSIVRRADGQIDAYSLYSGYYVRMEGGGATWGNSSGVINYGEVDEIYMASRIRGEDVWSPGNNKTSGGDRGSFENIDLSVTGTGDYSDRFNSASFKSINYATSNVYKGTAIVESFDSDIESGIQSIYKDNIVVNGIHDLILDQEDESLDGHLRLYVRDENSGLYNRFNEVFIGSSENDADENTYSTTSRNAYATNLDGGGVDKVDGTAMYGFDGNDTLIGGDDVDYLFGGTSTYSLKDYPSNQGNHLTGAAGIDYFGVGNIQNGLDNDRIMTTDFSGRLIGSAGVTGASAVVNRPLTGVSLTNELFTRAATDLILDWTVGVDYLRVLANGTAIIDGLGTINGGGGGYSLDKIGSDAERINLNDSNVLNQGKVVVRGLGGTDTIIGSSGNDYLYGNDAVNYINISSGGVDRVFFDTINGKQIVSGFDSGADDLFFLNKKVVDSFVPGGANISLNVNSWSVTQGVGSLARAEAYDSDINFLHSSFYGPDGYPSTNSQHTSADGTWNDFNSSADSMTFNIGVGMVALSWIPIVGPILRYTGLTLGGLGAAGVVPTTPHKNATYDGLVSDYVTVIPRSTANSKLPDDGNIWNDADEVNNYKFLDFFYADAGDGYLPVLELTHASNQGKGVYGYFAVHSQLETFVYLVASEDAVIENSEAIKVAEINGILDSADFVVYDGSDDIYNQQNISPVILVKPGALTVLNNVNDQIIFDGSRNGATDKPQNITVQGNFTGAVSVGSVAHLYDGNTLVSTINPVSNLLNPDFTFTDSRQIGTKIIQSDNSPRSEDNMFVLSDTYVRYHVALEDGDTGIVTRSQLYNLKVSGGNLILNGDDTDANQGLNDVLTISGDVDFNDDSKLKNIEVLVVSKDVGAYINLSAQTESFRITGSGYSSADADGSDSIVSGSGNDTIYGFSGQDTIDGGLGNDVIILDSTSDWLNAALDSQLAGVEVVQLNSSPVYVNLLAQSESFSVIGGIASDTVIGSSGADTISGGGGADSMDGKSGSNIFVFNTGDVVAGETVTFSGTTDTFRVDSTTDLSLLNGDAAFLAGLDTVALQNTNATFTVAQLSGLTLTVTGIAGASTDTLIINGTAGVGSINLTGLTVTNALVSVDGGASGETITWDDSTGAVSINGGDGDDTLDQAGGGVSSFADTLNGGNGNDTIYAGDGNDVITGGVGADNINGESGHDTIYGGDGNDIITGGIGTDVLSGELGADRFIFNDNETSFILFPSLTPVNGMVYAGCDVITDIAIGDSIDLTNASIASDVNGTLNTGEYLFVQGTYVAGTGAFTVGAGGSDSFLLFENGTGYAEGIFLVGVNAAEAAAVVNQGGVLTF